MVCWDRRDGIQRLRNVARCTAGPNRSIMTLFDCLHIESKYIGLKGHLSTISSTVSFWINFVYNTIDLDPKKPVLLAMLRGRSQGRN